MPPEHIDAGVGTLITAKRLLKFHEKNKILLMRYLPTILMKPPNTTEVSLASKGKSTPVVRSGGLSPG